MNARSVPLPWLLAGALVLFAAGLRLVDLAWTPLSNFEALAALSAAGGTPFESPFWISEAQPVSAAYSSLTGPLFSAFGASDGLARLVPALAGIALVGLPFLFVREMGWVSTLGASAMLAISSTALAASRTAQGAALAALAVGLLWFIGSRHNEADAAGTAVLAGFSLGLALAAGPEVWMGLFGLTLGLLMWRTSSPKDDDGLSLPPWLGGLLRREVLLIAALSFLALSTRFGFRVATMAEAIGAAGSWMQGWFDGSGVHVLTALLTLPLYEPLLLLGGLLGGLIAAKGADRSRSALVFWSLGALVAYLIYPGRQPIDLIWVVLPGSFLVGFALEEGLDRYRAITSWLAPASLAAVLLFLSAFTYLQLEQVVTGVGLVQLPASDQTLFGLAAITFLGALLFLFGFGWSWREMSLGLATFAVLTLAALTLSTAWRLTHTAETGARELWWREVSTPNLLVFQRSLEGISNAYVGREAGVQVGMMVAPPPSLAWSLRDHEPAQVGTGEEGKAPPVILVPEGEEPALPADYLGQSFALTEFRAWSGAVPPSLLDWWVDRRSPTEVGRWVLYVRTDVAGLGEDLSGFSETGD